MSTLVNVSGFSGGYTIHTPASGLSTFTRTSNLAYTSGSNVIWDTSTTDTSITYDNTTGSFTANFAGIYLIKMYVGITGMATGQSVHSNLSVGLASPLTMGYYSGNCAQSGVLNCPFIADVNMSAGQVFTFSLTLLSPTTITLLGSLFITSSIMYIG